MTTTIESPIRTATSGDRPRILATLTAAFSADPAVRWMYPDDAGFRRHFPGFVLAFAGGSIEAGCAHYGAGFDGAALWLPPGAEPDEAVLGAHLEQTTRGADQAALFAVFEEMSSYHPREPHLYLPLIGVRPAAQGRGLGAALLRHALQRCDRDRLPAYLESSNPRNVPLYQRHGFELLGTIQKGSSPPILPMLRRPR